MTSKDDEPQQASAAPAPAEAACNELINQIGEALVEGVVPDGDPQAALDKLGDIVGIYEASPLVEKDNYDPSAPLGERERTVVEQIKAEKAAADGFQGPKGDPVEGGDQGSELLADGQEEVFSRTEVEAGHIEHHSLEEDRSDRGDQKG